MITPLTVINRIIHPVPLMPPLGRCPVCHEDVRAGSGSMTLRGGIRVHRECASYRMRQRARMS
jgi:hypothetical protein